MNRAIPIVVAAAALGACAGSKAETPPADDPYFTLAFVEGAGTARFPNVAHADSFRIELFLERANGTRLTTPALVVRPAELGSFVLGDTGTGEPAAAETMKDGARFAVCATPAADGGVTLGFAVKLLKSRNDGAEVEHAEVSGTRWIEPGVVGLLARVTSPDGSGPMLVLARVVPQETGATPFVDTRDVKGAIELPMTGHTMHLRVSSVQLAREFEPGTVVDETAAPDLLKSAPGRVLHDFEVWSCLDRRVHLAGLVGADERGFTATIVEGVLHLSWKTTGATHTATIRPNKGRRFVAIARVEDGTTAGAIVSVDSDD